MGIVDGTALTADDLRHIAEHLDALASAGIDVREFRVRGFNLTVRQRTDGRNGTEYTVVRITGESGPMRSRIMVDDTVPSREGVGPIISQQYEDEAGLRSGGAEELR